MYFYSLGLRWSLWIKSKIRGVVLALYLTPVFTICVRSDNWGSHCISALTVCVFLRLVMCGGCITVYGFQLLNEDQTCKYKEAIAREVKKSTSHQININNNIHVKRSLYFFKTRFLLKSKLDLYICLYIVIKLVIYKTKSSQQKQQLIWSCLEFVLDTESP